MIQKFELKWDIVTLYGIQTIKWPYPPVAGVWGRWWPDLLAQKKARSWGGPGKGRHHGRYRHGAYHRLRLPHSETILSLKRLFRILSNFYRNFLTKIHLGDFTRLVRAATDRNPPTLGGGGCQSAKTCTRLFKRDGYSTTHAMYVWIFSCPTTTRGYETPCKASIQTFFCQTRWEIFSKKKQWPGPR